MNWKFLGLIIASVIILSVLFYLSPFSELKFLDCISPKGIPNPAGAQIQPICGYSLFMDNPPFPFKAQNSEFIEFCRKNIETIENSCNENVSSVIMVYSGLENSEEDEIECVYSMDSSHKILVLEKNPITEFGGEDTFYYKNLTISIYSTGYRNDTYFDYTKDCVGLRQELSSS